MQLPKSVVRQAAQNRLQQSPHAALRKVACECERGVLILRGRVPSFYHKQLAQEAIANIEGVVGVINEIEVVY
jgi:osmotically-inducible protein OsmY